MVSNKWKKIIHALQQKKYRSEYGWFLVEGAKSVQEILLSDFEIEQLFITTEFHKENESVLEYQNIPFEITDNDTLAKIGTFTTNNAAIAIAHCKPNQYLTIQNNEYCLVLDDIRDPGNLGTIIRIADWYGIQKIIASENSVDLYNPKTIAASMGSFTRVSVFYTHLPAFFATINSPHIFGAFLDGKNIHDTIFPQEGYLIMGNESKGISSEVEKFVKQRLTIPRFGEAESLNVAIATAICCDNIKR